MRITFKVPQCILHKKVVDFNSVFSAVVVPQILIKYLLHASHALLGHVGATKLYHFLKLLYYFKGMRGKIHEYVSSCHRCQIMNLKKLKLIDLHQDIAETSQDPLSIDLLGPYNATSQGNLYISNAVCNLTGYIMTTPIKDKRTTSVANYLFADIMLKFGFLRISHLDNGAEFKSKLMVNFSQQFGLRKTFISPCHPQANGKLESSDKFIKDCVWKFSIDGVLEWDQLLPHATAAFNWFPNEHSQESPHFLYFGCKPYLPLLSRYSYNLN